MERGLECRGTVIVGSRMGFFFSSQSKVIYSEVLPTSRVLIIGLSCPFHWMCERLNTNDETIKLLIFSNSSNYCTQITFKTAKIIIQTIYRKKGFCVQSIISSLTYPIEWIFDKISKKKLLHYKKCVTEKRTKVKKIVSFLTVFLSIFLNELP